MCVIICCVFGVINRARKLKKKIFKYAYKLFKITSVVNNIHKNKCIIFKKWRKSCWLFDILSN